MTYSSLLYTSISFVTFSSLSTNLTTKIIAFHKHLNADTCVAHFILIHGRGCWSSHGLRQKKKKKGVQLLWCVECVFGNEGVSDYLSFCVHPKCTAASMCTHCSKSKAACLRCSFAWKRKKKVIFCFSDWKNKEKKSQAPHNAFKSLKWFLHSTQMLGAVWTNTINIFIWKTSLPTKMLP